MIDLASMDAGSRLVEQRRIVVNASFALDRRGLAAMVGAS
jgi:hypothetical protein